MKGAMLYVNAGKGHYMPAKALYDSMIDSGYEAALEDLFIVLDTPFWEYFCKYDWRFLLHHPRFEPILHRMTDTRLNYKIIRRLGCSNKHLNAFKSWYENEKPDFIVSTNFLGGIILPAVIRELGIKVPIYQYAADVFDTPISGVEPLIDKMYLATQIGCDNAIRKGQPEDTVKLCPFPLQKKIAIFKPDSKVATREKLGLKNKFTVLYSMGGEGIGNPAFFHEIAKRKLDWQIVAIGGHSITMSNAINRFRENYPYFDIYCPGFVDNVGEYLIASDVHVGKAGANALMEAVYLKRPCLVSELLYAALATKDFFLNRGVGWCENSVSKQVDIIEKYANDESYQKEIKDNLDKLSLVFSADKFVEMIIGDTEQFRLQSVK